MEEEEEEEERARQVKATRVASVFESPRCLVLVTLDTHVADNLVACDYSAMNNLLYFATVSLLHIL